MPAPRPSLTARCSSSPTWPGPQISEPSGQGQQTKSPLAEAGSGASSGKRPVPCGAQRPSPSRGGLDGRTFGALTDPGCSFRHNPASRTLPSQFVLSSKGYSGIIRLTVPLSPLPRASPEDPFEIRAVSHCSAQRQCSLPVSGVCGPAPLPSPFPASAAPGSLLPTAACPDSSGSLRCSQRLELRAALLPEQPLKFNFF